MTASEANQWEREVVVVFKEFHNLFTPQDVPLISALTEIKNRVSRIPVIEVSNFSKAMLRDIMELAIYGQIYWKAFILHVKELKNIVDAVCRVPGVVSRDKRKCARVASLRKFYRLVMYSENFREFLNDGCKIMRLLFGESIVAHGEEEADINNTHRPVSNNNELSDVEWENLCVKSIHFIDTLNKNEEYRGAILNLIRLWDSELPEQLQNRDELDTPHPKTRLRVKRTPRESNVMEKFLKSFRNLNTKMNREDDTKLCISQVKEFLQNYPIDPSLEKNRKLANLCRTLANRFQLTQDINDLVTQTENLLTKLKQEEINDLVMHYSKTISQEYNFYINYEGQLQKDDQIFANLQLQFTKFINDQLVNTRKIPATTYQINNPYYEFWIQYKFQIPPITPDITHRIERDLRMTGSESESVDDSRLILKIPISPLIQNFEFYYKQLKSEPFTERGALIATFENSPYLFLTLQVHNEKTPRLSNPTVFLNTNNLNLKFATPIQEDRQPFLLSLIHNTLQLHITEILQQIIQTSSSQVEQISRAINELLHLKCQHSPFTEIKFAEHFFVKK